MDGWKEAKAGLRIAYSNQKIRQNGLIFKIKFLIISKLNFNEGQIYKKKSNFDYFKN